jgi:hypothetical protein
MQILKPSFFEKALSDPDPDPDPDTDTDTDTDKIHWSKVHNQATFLLITGFKALQRYTCHSMEASSL